MKKLEIWDFTSRLKHLWCNVHFFIITTSCMFKTLS